MLFLLLSFENDHRDVTALLRFHQFLLNFAHEADIDVDVFIRLQLTFHRSDCEHLFGCHFFHPEVKADRVLTLVLQVQWELFGLTNTHCPEVKLRLHTVIQRDIEGF